MPERPSSRYTRAKTWAALYSQNLLACYAIVPFSLTQNSIDLIPCQTPREARLTMETLLAQADTCATFYSEKEVLTERVWMERPDLIKAAVHAVVLAKSSDYHHYSLSAHATQFRLVVCGQHDSYLLLPCWETTSNKSYKARETALVLGSPTFWKVRKTEYGHALFTGALVCGDQRALELLQSEKIPPRTRRRIKSEVQELQQKRYQGRPLAFLTEEERRVIGARISDGLKRYYAQQRS